MTDTQESSEKVVKLDGFMDYTSMLVARVKLGMPPVLDDKALAYLDEGKALKILGVALAVIRKIISRKDFYDCEALDVRIVGAVELLLYIGFYKGSSTPLSDYMSQCDDLLSQALGIMNSKSHDYAEASNRYSNFEEAGGDAGITPAQSILNLVGIKRARLKQLTSGKQALHESLLDSVLDAINYLLILGGYMRGLQ